MNKSGLVGQVMELAQIKKSDAEHVVEAVFSVIADSLSKGEEVRLIGFGTFAVKQRQASEGRNPRTGEPLVIPARKSVKFQPSKVLKEGLEPKKAVR